MRSPFPGMDPYIEACGLWEGFHSHLIEAIYQAIATVLPQGYTVDTAVRSYVVLMESDGKRERLAKPEKFEETFVEIYPEGEERVLVTCIEVLSPSNKRRNTAGWQEYTQKRQAMLLGQANFVEIDLVRGGHKMPMLDPWPDSPYTLLLCRRSEAPHCHVWPAHFRRRLPPILVPLLDPDPDLTLDLQPLLDGIYSLGRYQERIDYTRRLTPALPAGDAAWVRELLKDRHPRSGPKS